MMRSKLRSDQLYMQKAAAAGTVGNLAGGSQENRDAIIAAGAAPLLSALSNQSVVQQVAAPIWQLGVTIQLGCNNCSKRCASACYLIELIQTSHDQLCKGQQQALCQTLEVYSAASRYSHGSKSCTSADCFAEVRTANCAGASSWCSEYLAPASQAIHGTWLRICHRWRSTAIFAAGAVPLLVALLRSDHPVA